MSSVLTRKPPVLKEPTTQKADVLYELIMRSCRLKTLTEQEMPVKINGFRGRISELINEDGLNVQYEPVKNPGRRNKPRVIHAHYLFQDDIETAVELYNRINR
jgi:hypothetical protein